jgi:O-antigen/teichoic acid export membrane protein
MIITRLLNLVNRDIFKSLSVYTALGFINKAFPILLLPFLTRVLTPADYGIMAMFATVKSFFGPFIGLGSASSVERYYFDKKELNFPSYLSNIILIALFTTVFFGSLFLLFSDYISSLSGVPKSFLWIVIVVSLGSLVNKINLIIYRVQFKSMSFAYLSLFETGVYFLLMIVLVFGFKFNWRADVYTQLIIYSILGVWGIYILKKSQLLDFTFQLNKEYIKSALAFGLPMFVHTFGLFFVNMTDKLFITKFIGIEATGIYTIGFKMATIIVFFITAFNNAYVPWLYGKLKTNTKASLKRAYSSTFYSGLFVAFAGGLLLVLLPYLYPILVGEKFASSIHVSKIIVVGEVFNAFYLLLMSYILFAKATKYIMYITLSTSIVSVGLNIWLIPQYGILGAANVLLGVYFLKFLLTFLFVFILYRKNALLPAV